LNIGGCNKLDDDIAPTLASLSSLVHLNLAVTRITDYGISIIVDELRHLTVVNLFGMKFITRIGAREVVDTQMYLRSLNLRGAGEQLISNDTGKMLKELCNQQECEVLTGKAKDEGIY